MDCESLTKHDNSGFVEPDDQPAGWGRRSTLIALFFSVGLGTPGLMYLLVVTGAIDAASSHSDRIGTVGVLLSVYCPFLAFFDNPGERRTAMQKLHHFGRLWFIANTGYQLCWELPWFCLKIPLTQNHITADDRWAWPWWAYGSGDTRYLHHNDLVIGISWMDAMASVPEVILVWCSEYKQYRVLGAWAGLLIQFAMSWGQMVWYGGELYNLPAFKNIAGNWFAGAFKYGILNIPWCVFPLGVCTGFSWFLATVYRNAGPSTAANPSGKGWWHDFKDGTLLFQRHDLQGRRLPPEPNPWQLTWGLRLALVFPIVFFVVDYSIWRRYS